MNTTIRSYLPRLAPLFMAVLVFSSSLYAADEDAKIIRLSGKTEIYTWGMWHPAEEGQQVRPGESVRVIGPGEVTVETADGRIKVTGKDDTTLLYNGLVDTRITPWKNARIARDPEYRADEDAPKIRQFFCPEGEVSVEATTGERLNLVTPLITASVRGTVFNMNVSDNAASGVNVANGMVDAFGRMSNRLMVCPGERMEVSSKQFLARLRCSGYCLPEDADWREYDYDVFDALDEYMFQQVVQ